MTDSLQYSMLGNLEIEPDSHAYSAVIQTFLTVITGGRTVSVGIEITKSITDCSGTVGSA